jgi:hypothetical protein
MILGEKAAAMFLGVMERLCCEGWRGVDTAVGLLEEGRRGVDTTLPKTVEERRGVDSICSLIC